MFCGSPCSWRPVSFAVKTLTLSLGTTPCAGIAPASRSGMPARQEERARAPHGEAHRVDPVRVDVVAGLGDLDHREQEALAVHAVPRVVDQTDPLRVHLHRLRQLPLARRLAGRARTDAAAVETEDQPVLWPPLARLEPPRATVGRIDARLRALRHTRPVLLHGLPHDGDDLIQGARGGLAQGPCLLEQGLTRLAIPVLEVRSWAGLHPALRQVGDLLAVELDLLGGSFHVRRAQHQAC